MKEVYEANPPACARTEVALSGTGTTKFALRLTLAAAFFCFSVLGVPSAFAANGGDDLTCDIAYAGAPTPPPPFPPLPPGSIVVCLNGLGQTSLNASLLGPFTTTSNPSCNRVRIWTADPDDPDGADNILGNVDDPQEVVVGHPLYTRDCSNISAGIADYTEVWVTREIFQQGVDPCRSGALPFRIYIADCTRPTLACPPAKTYTCANEQIADNPPALMNPTQFAAIGGSVSDNCTVTVAYTDGAQTNVLCANKYQFTRTFTATDQSGNTRTCTQLITVSDETPPVFLTPPSNLTIACQNYANFTVLSNIAVQAWLAAIGGATYSDNCGDLILPGVLFCLSTTVGCSYSAPLFAATVRSHMPDACSPLPREVEVVFTIQDACGNETSTSAKVILIDSQEPTLFDSNGPLPGGVTWVTSGLSILGDADEGGPYDCLGLIPAPNPESVRTHVTDNCTPQADLTIVWVSDVPASVTGCGTPYDIITRTYQVDDCDPTTPSLTVTQEIRIKDDVAPSWTNNPNTVTLSCETTDAVITAWLDNHGDDGAASDLCNAPVTITNNTTAAALIASLRNWCPSSAPTRSETVTFTATDACGNTSTRTATITLFDLEGPTATNPANVTVNCVADITQNITDVLDETDNCSSTVTVTTIAPQVIVSGTGCRESPIIIRQRYQMSDCAGNTSVVSRLVTVQDTIAPIWTVNPTDLSIPCDGPGNEVTLIQNWLTANGNGTATDNCTDVLYSTSPNTGANVFAALRCARDTGYTTIVTFIASDSCGSTVSRTARVTLTDNTAPTATATPANYNCVENLPAYNIGVVTGISDNCATIPQITVIARPDLESNNGGDGCPDDILEIYRRYQITDCTGNSAIVTQTITVIDNVDPTAECQSITVDLDATGQVVVNAVDFAANIAQGFEGPFAPANWTLTTNGGNGNVDASGAPSSLVLVGSDTGSDSTIATTYCITPPQAGTISFGWNYTTLDVSPFWDPFGYSVGGTPTQLTNNIGANNQSGSAMVAVSAGQSFCFYTVATDDDSGPSITVTDMFFYEANADNCPGGTTYEFSRDENPLGSAGIPDGPYTASKVFNCSDIPDINNCDASTNNSQIIAIALRVIDACGNANTCNTWITVRDVQNPVIPTTPDVTVTTSDRAEFDCKANVTITPPQITENCTIDCYTMQVEKEINNTFVTINPATGFAVPNFRLQVSPDVDLNYVFEKGPKCEFETPMNPDDQYRITYYVRDEHGNAHTSSFIITVQDDEAPLWEKCPQTIIADVVTNDCYQTKSWERPLPYDNCMFPIGPCDTPQVVVTASDPTVMVNFIQNSASDISQFPIGTTYVYYTATDACGNTSTCTITVQISDTQAPMAMCIGSPITINMEPDGDTEEPYSFFDTGSTDNCGVCAKEVGRDGIFGDKVIFTCADVNTTVLVTLRVTDCSAPIPNEGTCTVAVVVEDMQQPGIAQCPADITVGTDADVCNAVVTYNTPLFNDGCNSPKAGGLVQGLLSGSTFPIGNTLVSYSYTSIGSGFTVYCNFNVTVEDDQAPSLVCPSNVTGLTCTTALPAPFEVGNFGGTLTDNCGVVLLESSDYDNGFSSCPNDGVKVISRTYTAWDAEGNTSVCTQSFTFLEDAAAPVFTPASLSAVNGTCSGDVPAVPTVTAADGDGCGGVTIDFEETITSLTGPGAPSCPNKFVVTRTWVASDICGNQATLVQVITINDDVNPVLSSRPADQSFECAASVSTPATVTATDNCGSVTVAFSETTDPGPTSCPNSFIIRRTWLATDACGNTDVHTQTITVNDTTNPTLSSKPADATVTCAALVPAVVAVTATDNCGVVNLDFSETTVPLGCENKYQVIRRWVATDLCGNVDSHTQTITVNDTEAPVFSNVPASTSVICAASVPAVSQPTATDNCGVVNVDFAEYTVPGDCPNSYTVIRRWVATDLCGNRATTIQTIVVNDQIAPTFNESLPGGLTVSCAQDVPTAAVLTATDNCDGGVQVIYSEELRPGDCPNQFSIVRTWTAEDLCGNLVKHVQTIIVSDTQAPVWNEAPAANITTDCANNVTAAPVYTAADNCGIQITVDYSEELLPGTCSNSFTLVRRWRAQDDCGNVVTRSQTVTVNDNVQPNWVETTLPASFTAACSEAINVAEVLTATDNCGQPLDVEFYETTDWGTCPNDFVVKRRWYVQDDCGNAREHVQTITILDNLAPTWNQAAPTAVVNGKCADDVPVIPTQTATDNCNKPVDVEFSESIYPGLCANSFSIIRRWTAEDDCGNITSREQTIIINDDVAPVLANLPAAVVAVDCAEKVPAVAPVTVTDNCGSVVDLDFSEVEVPGTCPNQYQIVRTWQAVDVCGNATSFVQTITINDTQAPVWTSTLPGNLSLACGESIPAAATLTASDNCGAPVDVEFNETWQPGAGPNDGNVLVRTWTAEDDCGNAISYVQTITVNDVTAPVLGNLPQALVNVSCSEQVPAVAAVTVTDNCQGTVDLEFSEVEVPGTCPNQYSITRTWTAVDFAGNATIFVQTITVLDNVAPVLAGLPASASVNVSCSEQVPAVPTVTATDNCGAPVDVEFSEVEVPGTCPNQYSITRTWTAEDDCGNLASFVQTINISDIVAPVLAGLPTAFVNVSCSEQVPQVPNVTATDNCGAPVDLEFSEVEVPGTCPNQYSITRTWSAEDDCGNIASFVQVITINDTEAPVLANLPAASVSVSCAESVPAVANVTATDNCNQPVDLEFSEVEVPGTCPNQYSITRTWTAEDDCGNATSFVQTITVSDTQAPTWTSSLPGNLTLQCGEAVPAAATLTASDNCNQPVDIELSETWQPGAGPNDGNILVRTWTAEDDCGNAVSHVQTITVNDVVAPVLGNLPAATVSVSCSEQVPAVANVTVSDNCQGTVDLEFSEVEVPGTCPNQYSITRTWTAVDFAGNATSFVQTITISDTQAPVLSGLPTATVSVSCSEQVPAVASVTATDNCGAPVDVEFFEVEVPGTCPNQYSITRTWTAEDDCGNITSFVQTITISDTQAPVLAGLPAASVRFACSEQVPAVATVTATDNCGAPVDVEFFEVEAPGTCPNQYSITRTWTAEDDCGNITSFVQTITIEDLQAPVFAGLPAASVSVSCSEQVPAVANVTATDNCNQPVDIELSEVEVPGTCPNQYQIRRTWTAEDDCGNAVSFVQTITISDTQAPVWTSSLPGNQALQCGEAVPAAAALTASDNCNQPVDIELSETWQPGAGPNDGNVLVRTWTAEDDCGNAISHVQTITVNDVVAPVLGNLPAATVSVSCSEQVPAVANVTATDNCQGTLFVTFSEVEVPGTCANQYQVRRTWTAVDFAGNATSFVQTITVSDTQAPVFSSLPTASVSVSCSEQVPAVASVTATDNCGAPVDVEFSEVEVPGTCPNQYSITRTWTAEDDCGNITSFVQTITISDNQVPVLSNLPAASVSASCSEQVPAVANVTATDNCNQPVDLEFSEVEVPGTCPNQYQIVRTWTAEDDCGNATSFVQTITISDTQAPVMSNLPVASVNVSCSEQVPAVANVTATDNCNQPVDLEFSEVEVPGTCPNQYQIRRTWTAEDDCGNAVAFVQTITISDTQAPAFVGTLPANFTLQCGETVPAAPALTATDNCNQPVDVEFNETYLPGAGPNDNATMVRTWTAEDDCGNLVSHVQTITINDVAAPVFAGLPAASVNVSCASAVPAVANVTASDNCQGTLTVTFSEVEVSGGCPNRFTLTRTWTATDFAGNAVSFVQTINVNDNVAPVVSCPAPLTAQCSVDERPVYANLGEFNLAGGTASDNCGLSINDFGLASQTNVGNVFTRVYRVTDQCGNAATCAQTITVLDTQAPVFLNCPTGPVVVGNDADKCSAKVNWGIPVAVDNCGNPTVAQISGPTSGSILAVGNYTVVYRATDAAGNNVQCSFGVQVMDTQAPTFDADITMPNDTTVQCNGVPSNCVYHGPLVCTPLTNADVSDNCGSATVSFAETSTQCSNQAQCCFYNYTVTRRWTATDAAGNSRVHTQVITVVDSTKPTAVCKNFTLTLDKFGVATLTPADINNGSFDNCAAAQFLTLSLSKTSFNCSNLGANTVTLTVTDPCGNFGTCNATVTVVEGQGSCTPQFNVVTSCKDNATNLDNGQFVDLITVKALAGQTWTISGNTGLFSNNSPNPPVAPTALPVGTQLIMGSADGINNDGDSQTDEADEMVYYTIRGVHVDGIGYNIGLSNNIGQTATISNRAYYPTPIFLNLDGPFCLSTPPFTIQVGEQFGAAGTVTSIRVNGVATNTFNAGQLGIGFHNVEAIFDAGAATSNLVINGVLVGGTNDQALADPGCKQIITKSVQVIGTPTTVACNDVIHVSLDADCQETITPDMVLEGSYFCYDDYSVIITYPTGTATFTPPNRVNATHIGKTIMFSLRHILSGNLCWGTIIVEDKLAPVVSCPSNRTILCTQNEDNLSLTGTPIVDDCSAFTTVREDQYEQFSCAQNNTVFTRVSRLWVATDAWGNKDSCTQIIDILRGTVDQVNFPADVEYVCTNVPASLQPGTTGWPTIAGVSLTTSGTGACGLAVSFSDEFAQVCPGSYKIIRTWKINDWCSPGTGGPSSKEFIQFIKVTDVAPTVDLSNFTYDADNDWYVINTNAIVNGQCVSAGPIPTAIFNGVCNQVVDVKVTTPLGPISNGGLLPQPGLGLGVHNITYVLTDECGNITSITIKVNVIDNTPPAISCDEFTQVAVGGSGFSEVFAETFNDGTYDNCCLDGFLVRRMVDGPCDNDDVEDDFADRVVFCCADINDTVTVVLRAFDCYGNHNDCMVSVFVEDKIKPVCTSPGNVTVSCENFDPSLWAYGMPSALDNCCVDTITTTVNIAQFDTLCNKGTITRTFRAFDCGGNSAQCSQRIVVQYEQDYFVRFPNDVIVTTCNGTPNFGEPTFFGEDCELLAVSYTDEIFTVVPDACYKIEREWRIINWCTFNPNLPVVSVPNPNPNAIANNPANLTGPIVSAPGSTAPWTSIPLALLPGQTPHDFTQYYTGNPAAGIPSIANSNGFSYKQIIKVIDNKAPVFANCPASPVTINDLSGNDPLLWNQMYYWDNANQNHDLCEGTVDLSVAITDSCGGSDVTVKYLLFLDLDNSGDMETVVSSTNIPAANTVFFGNANNPNFTGGTAYNFDNRPVALNQKYRFNIDVVKSGNTATAKLIWDTPQVPANLNDAAMQGVAPQLPYGTHKIKWITNDGCGNEAVCEYLIVVRDGKAPTVVCLNGLSVNIMPTQMITLFASDFLQYTEDNCSPATLLDIAIVESDESTGSFPVDGQGNPLTTVNFNCQEVGTQLVQLWSRDVAGNADYCETYVIVQDPNNFCDSDPISVAGDLKTETQNGLEDASVELIGTHPALPPVSMFDMTNNNGAYAFSNALPVSANYSVTPLKDDNHLNGVTTFDLVLISKHILGLEPLGSPYKMIAADANKSNSITTFDIVELRKLILGIYTELPNNTSWRFVDKSYNFANPNNPFTAQFPEFKSVADVQASHMNDDFVSLKVGDVNGSAIANSLMSADDRTVGTLLFDVEDRQVKAGEEFTVNFTAAEQVIGYQFTMNLKGLEVVDIVPGAGMEASNFGLFNDAITTSFDGKDKGAFALKLRAKTSGQLSNMLGVSSRITKAEAYKNDVRLDVAFRFNGSTIAGVGFELYQNTPNPFINKTMIGFHLPEATEATLTIFDESGRMIFTQTGDFGKGYNAVTLDREMVNTTGLLYYKLETATDSATKKMIQTK